ncbi:hypothetical protein [Nostoc sp. MS1]|uniref:hypothetical protein n=1 Tax=Nostoc sp. MS1 TaxID=2764711 RepID=UPI001CC50439|nr:hypothetical protein [Nostoc sp. MS1]
MVLLIKSAEFGNIQLWEIRLCEAIASFILGFSNVKKLKRLLLMVLQHFYTDTA